MKKSIIKYIFFLLFLAGAFFLGTAYTNTKELFMGGLNSENRLIGDVRSLIDQEFLNDVDQTKLHYGMARGLVSSLDDPYSEFFDPEEAKMFWNDLGGEFEGIGVEIIVDQGKVKVLTVLDESPAKRSGVLANDVILAVNDTDVSGKSLGEIASIIQGPTGSEVTLTVLRGEELIDIKITREKMKADSVFVVAEDGLLTVRIIRFDENTDQEFVTKLAEYDLSQYRGMIVDVRSNPGGYFDSCVKLIDYFLSDGLMVTETDHKKLNDEYRAKSGDKYESIPLVVMIDGGSASASEILAGAIKDNERGQIVGTKSYGKGTVQVVEELYDGSILKLTVAEWLTPKGNNITKNGIEPNVEVEGTEEGKDEQLEKAKELLLK